MRRSNEAEKDAYFKPPVAGRVAEISGEKEWSNLIRDQPLTSARKRQYAIGRAVQVDSIKTCVESAYGFSAWN
jgi:hypothetical protein